MLYYVTLTIYVLVCGLLIITILLQQGKGGDIANAFGGGSSQAVFGARSGATDSGACAGELRPTLVAEVAELADAPA